MRGFLLRYREKRVKSQPCLACAARLQAAARFADGAKCGQKHHSAVCSAVIGITRLVEAPVGDHEQHAALELLVGHSVGQQTPAGSVKVVQVLCRRGIQGLLAGEPAYCCCMSGGSAEPPLPSLAGNPQLASPPVQSHVATHYCRCLPVHLTNCPLTQHKNERPIGFREVPNDGHDQVLHLFHLKIMHGRRWVAQ